MIGTRVRHWRIEERLSKAGMGEVYRARDEKLLRDVAIKFLPKGQDRQQQSVTRFIKEARAASALNHPNIVTIFDTGSSRAGHYIVMELVSGRTLRDWAVHNPGFENLIPISVQIAKALAVAHEAGIVHRDIKPENIMVRTDGYVKLVDFGLARWSDSAKTDATQTVSGSLLGTLRYMSPEQAAGEPVQTSSDIFSFGVVLYELIAGIHPFDAATELEILQAIASKPLPPVRHWAPDIPPGLDALIVRMLQRPAWQRPAAADVMRTLENLDDTTAVANPTRVVPRQYLVGRHAELVKLRASFEAVLGGSALLVAITGEPGIGKTALVEEFLSEQAASRRVCAIGRGSSSQRLAGAEAYLPILEALEDLIRHQPSLASVMHRTARNWYGQIFHKPAEQTPSLSQLRAASRELMNRELIAFFEEASMIYPVVLFLDDLHWADESTIDLIAFLVGHLPSAPILFLATYRPEEMQIHHEQFPRLVLDLQARRRCRVIDLPFLKATDIRALLSLEFPQNSFPDVFFSALHARTEGNPFFVVEVLRYLRDKQVISQSGDTWTLSENVPNIERDLPQSVIGMLQRKIELLSNADRRLLAAASIQGFEFDAPVVARTLSMDAADVEERLDALYRLHGVIQHLGERELPDKTVAARYRFVHYLYYSAFYNAIQPARKAAWSAIAAKALIDFHRDQAGEIAAQIGFLFESARDFARAADYFSKAAGQAIGVFAHHEAELLARRGLRALEATPQDALRAQKELDLLLKLGMPLLSTKTYGNVEVEQIFNRARQLSVQLGENPRLFPALWGLETYFVARLDLPTALDIGAQLLRLVQNSEDTAMVLTAHLGAGAARYCSGDFLAALEHFRFYRQYDDSSTRVAAARRYGLEPGIMLRTFEGRLLWWLGYFEQSVSLLEAALDMARQLQHAPTFEFVLSMASTIGQYLDDVDRCDRAAEELIHLGEDHGLQLWIAQGVFLRGWVRSRREADPAPGLDVMREGITSYRSTGTALFLPHAYSFFACVCAEHGLTDRGFEVIADAQTLPCAALPGGNFYSPELLRAEGELLRVAGDCKRAETVLRQALEDARRQSSRFSELRVAVSLARVLRLQGFQNSAEILRDVYNNMPKERDIPDMVAAREELSKSF